MPAYQYIALEASGQERTGVLEADTAKTARAQLRTQGLTPMDVNQVSANSEAGKSIWQKNLFGSKRVFDRLSLAVWTRQLAGLVLAGLPLERALTALMDQLQDRSASAQSSTRANTSESRQATLVAALRAEVNAGATFAKALAEHPEAFDATYCAVVAAGEQGGDLGGVLDSLASELEAQQLLRSKIVSAALYPVIVCVIAMTMVFFLMTYVVPQVAQVFVGSKRALPLLTTGMLALSEHARSYWWLWLVGWAGLYAALCMALKGDAFRARFDAWWLTLPLIGRLARGLNAARFGGTLSMLAGSGVPILKGLQTATQTLSNRAMQLEAEQATVQVREGASLGAALGRCQQFPSLLAMFARLGEQTGQLPVMLARASAQLSGEVQRRALALTTLLEPLLVVAMGVVVLLIVLAVLLPIVQMNQMVR